MNFLALLIIHWGPNLFTNIGIKKLSYIVLEVIIIYRLIRFSPGRSQWSLFKNFFDGFFLFLTIFDDFSYSLDNFSEVAPLVDIVNSPAKGVFKISFTEEGIYSSIELLTVRIVIFGTYFFDFRESIIVKQVIRLVLLVRFFLNVFK